MYPYIREVCSVNWLPRPCNTPTQHDINAPIHQGGLQCQLAPQTLQHTNTTWHQCTHTSGRSAVSTGSPDPGTHQHNMTSMYPYIREVCSFNWLPRPCNTPWHQCTHTSGRSAVSTGSPDPGTHQHNMTSMYPYIKEVCSVNWLPRPWNTPTQHDINVLIHQGGLQRHLAPQTLQHTNTTWHQCTHTSGRSAVSTGSPDPGTHQHNMTSMYPYIKEVCSVNWLPRPWNTPTQHDINVPIHQGGLQHQLAPQTLQHTNTTWHQCTHTSGRSAVSTGSPDPGTHQHNMTSMYPYIREVCSVNWLPTPWNTPTQHDINVPIHQGSLQCQLAPQTLQHTNTTMYPYIREVCSVNWLPRPCNTPTQHDINVLIHQGGLQRQLAPQTLQHTNTTWHQCTHTSGRSAVSTGSPDPGTHQHNMTSMYPYIKEVCSVNWLSRPWNTPRQHDINVLIHQGGLQCQLAPQTLQHTNTTWHQCTHTSGRSAASTGSPDPGTHQHTNVPIHQGGLQRQLAPQTLEHTNPTWHQCTHTSGRSAASTGSLDPGTHQHTNVPIHQGGLQRQLAP